MKKILLQIFIVALLPLACIAQNTEWHKYTSAAGHYSINFPGQFTESTEIDSSGATLIKMNLVEYTPDPNTVFMSSYVDFAASYPADQTVKQILENSRDGALASLGVTKSTTLNTNLTGDPYIEFSFSGPDFVGKDRIYVINKVQYSIICIFAHDAGLNPNTDKFIQSFKHNN